MANEDYEVIRFHKDLPLERRIDYLELVAESLQLRVTVLRKQAEKIEELEAQIANVPKEITPRLHYKTAEIAELLNCSTRHVHNLLHDGKLKYWKDGSYNKVAATELERYIEEGYARTQQDTEEDGTWDDLDGGVALPKSHPDYKEGF
jgi:excisionase family DNA binding protein